MINMRKLLVSMSLIMVCSLLAATQLKISVDTGKYGKSTDDYPRLLEPGQPKLNYYPLRVLLPFGEEFESAEISLAATKSTLTGQYVEPAQAQVPISRPQDFIPTSLDPRVYEQDAFFPARDFDYLGTEYYRGYAIAIFNVYPFRYNPVSKEIRIHDEFEIQINSTFSPERAAKQSQFVTKSTSSMQQLMRLVENPQESTSYADYSAYKTRSRNLDPADARMMLVITDEEREDWFAEYVSWREDHGISTGIYTTEYIYANYDGVDDAEKVRNFIIDAYATFADTDSPLEYVILGGDDEIVPERGVWGRVGSTRDNRMPSDLYYSNLDGDWNANGNTIYGELTDDTDMIPELHIGRFTAESWAEFNNIFRKTMYYVDQSTFSNNVAIFFGENLNNNPLTWGGDYKDDIHQYLPGEYQYSTQYQRDGTYSAEGVWNTLNAGANVMNHMGHANETYLMGQGNNTIQQLSNTEYGFLYSQGCYPAAFDQRTSEDGESIGEHLLMASGGTFAFVGNTRYGWYMPGSIDGASQFYDRQYFSALYEQDIPQLGDALTYSRLENLNAALQSDVMRWCYMEMILFGDPSVAIKLPDPMLPMLDLVNYEFDDSDGDNDGVINPGETVRLYPEVHNAEGWATAYDVSISVEDLPHGMQSLGSGIQIQSIAPGQSNPQDLYIELEIPEDLGYGKFYLNLMVDSIHPDTGLSTGVRRFEISFDVTLFDGRFPWETANAGKSAPIVTDLNSDGSKEILFADVFGGVHIIGEDGLELDFFSHPEQQNINRSSAMGQIDGQGGDDLVFTSRSGNIYAITTGGDLIFSYSTSVPFLNTPVIADISGNSEQEVIAGAMDGKLYVLDAQGDDLPGFPLQLSGSYTTELAVGELAASGQNLIIAGLSSGDVRVIGAGGQIFEEYSHNLGSRITGAPVILDNGRFAIATNTTLYLIDEEGIVFQKAIDSTVAGGLITADFNRDGSLDILFVSISGKVWAVNQTGQDLPGYPQEITDNFNCPPLVADISADGQYEIVLHSYLNSIYAYHHDGSNVDGFPFRTSYNGATPGTLVDYDDDGYFKLITGFSNGILMSNLRRPSSELMPWVTYRGSLSRQGSFSGTGYVSNADAVQSPHMDRLQQNYPNPFNPNTTIAFDLEKAGELRLEIFNTKGQKVRSLIHSSYDAGAHTVNWDATDDAGRRVSSGLYLYRMQSASGSQTRKMLLLK